MSTMVHDSHSGPRLGRHCVFGSRWSRAPGSSCWDIPRWAPAPSVFGTLKEVLPRCRFFRAPATSAGESFGYGRPLAIKDVNFTTEIIRTQTCAPDLSSGLRYFTGSNRLTLMEGSGQEA